MNFKRFHESKNLFYKKISGANIDALGRIMANSEFDLAVAKVTEGETYSVSGVSAIMGFYDNEPELGSASYNNQRETIVSPVTIPQGVNYVAYRVNARPNVAMLNTGSEPLPYEPYSSEVWHDIPHYIHKTATDTLTLPAVIYPNDTTITVGLKGNEEHTGTPSPQNPVMPNGTGDMSGNLCDESTIQQGYYGSSGNISTFTSDSRYRAFKMSIKAGTYTIKIQADEGIRLLRIATANEFYNVQEDNRSYAFIISADATMYVSWRNLSTTDSFTNMHVMLNTGSTALPYEPYGYKIPILLNSTTINKYLGEVQTVRQIKKLVLTGQEIGWGRQDNCFRLSLPDSSNTVGTIISTHFEYKIPWTLINTTSVGACVSTTYYGTAYKFLMIRCDDIATSTTDFKTYLQQQYSNGTPVTVWYVLANETTGIVNEPLMKIGTYADSLTTSIPVTAGENTLDVQTTVQPSEVSAGFSGWHPITDVHVYPDSSWMPTSWEEFRKAVRLGKDPELYPIGTKLYENWGDATSNAWIVVDYPTGEDYLDSDLAQQGYTNRVMLMEEKLNYLKVFDTKEAWLYVETAIPAGTYRFTIPNYDASYGGNKTYIFTSTANVPVGGQLTLTWAYNTNPTKVQGYSSSTSTTALFDVNIAEWDGTTACTDLGTIKLAIADADSTYGKLNHIHRARYGSNNYYQSGLRQWLNADATANNWWTPSNIFDRPYDNRNTAGRLNALNSNMKAVLATPTVNCITNNLFEYPSLDGTTFLLQTAYTVKDKLFLVTHTETNLSSTPNVDSVLAYYTNAQNADRIKYRKDNGNAYYWWLRTPYPTDASHVRYVSPSGAVNYNYARYICGSAAACIIQ